MAQPESPLVLWIDRRAEPAEPLTERLRADGVAIEHLNGGSLLGRLRQGGVDLIVCDLDGVQPDLLRELRGATADEAPGAPAVIALAQPESARTEPAAPSTWRVATKPVSPETLRQLIDRVAECRLLRQRVRHLESTRQEVVLRSVHDLTSTLGLQGTLESVLHAADLLVQPLSAAIWLLPPGEAGLTAVTVLPSGPDAVLEPLHEQLAEGCYDSGESIWSSEEHRHYTALPIIVEEKVEGVLTAAFERGAALLDSNDSHRVLAALAEHAGRAIVKERLYADLERSSAKISSLFEVGLAMSSETSLQQLFQVVVDSAAEICSARRCSLMLILEDRQTMQMRAARGIPAEVVKVATCKVGEGIAGGVAASGKALLVTDIEKDHRFARKNQAQYSNSSLVSVPVLVNNRVVGVLNVNDKRDGTGFTENDLNLLVLLASQAAVAIDNAHRYEDLSEKAVTDSLTGVYIRRFFDESLDRSFRSARTTGRTFALLMIDIDRFKSINDTYGHPTGDEALRRVAQALRGAVRDEDSVSRYGGEEFAILLARANQPSAVAVAERIRAAVEKTVVEHAGATFSVTVSIGAAAFDERWESAEQMVIAADRALYTAKETGRNRVVSGQPES